MGGRDLNDRHQAGELDIDTAIAPLEIGEIPFEDAEDLWLTVIALTPARSKFSRVQRDHLSDRGKVILEIIRAHSNEGAGWPQVAPEHLESQLAEQVRRRYWAAVKRPEQPLDLRSIPSRLRHFAPEDLPLEVAEDTLIRAWTKRTTIALHKHVAGLAERDGPEAAETFYSQKKARMAALTAGVRWVPFGQVAREYAADIRAAIERPDTRRQVIGTGFPAIDAKVRNWGPEKFTVIAGWNGHGKSTLIAQILSQMAISGVNTFYLSGEDAMRLTVERMIAWYLEDMRVAARLAIGTPEVGKIEGYRIADVYEVERLVRNLERLPLFFLHMPGATLGQVLSAIVDGARSGAKVGAHDYVGTVAQPPRWEVMEWRNHCMRSIKDAFVSNGMHGIEGAQLTRPAGKNEKAESSRPNRYMIEYCTAAEQAADYVMLAWRKQKDKVSKRADGRFVPLDVEDAEIIVDKSKDNKGGVIQVGWCTTRHRFEYRAGEAEQTNLADRASSPPEDPRDDDPF